MVRTAQAQIIRCDVCGLLRNESDLINWHRISADIHVSCHNNDSRHAHGYQFAMNDLCGKCFKQVLERVFKSASWAFFKTT
jgi:hypothetical protein